MTDNKQKEPGAWDKMHPILRIVVMILIGIFAEIFMIIIGMVLSTGSSSGIVVLIFSFFLPLSLIGAAIYSLLKPKKEQTDEEAEIKQE
jgi:hypothetical protein